MRIDQFAAQGPDLKPEVFFDGRFGWCVMTLRLRAGDDGLIARGTATKLGVPVSAAHVTYRRIGGAAEACEPWPAGPLAVVSRGNSCSNPPSDASAARPSR